MNTIQGEKYVWQLSTVDSEDVMRFASNYNLSIPIVQTLLSRGYTTKQRIEDFLFVSFERDVPHASQLADGQKAVDRILQAIENKEKILVFGDYDVDGITSAALMMICLMPLGAEINFFLPNRVKDGYGLSSRVVERAAKNGYTIIITVDNGITAFDAALKAQELNIDLVITDHHKPHDHLPAAYAIVNPNRDDCGYPFKHLAGVGVTFKIMQLLYEKMNLSLPEKAYELLLLGTIADVVPLQGENRYWVRYGLNYVNGGKSVAFETLCTNGGLSKAVLSATDIGFSITPQINALGRLEDPRDGVGFLIGNDRQKVDAIGRVLVELNKTRKEIERSIFQQVDLYIKQGKIDLTKENMIVAASNSWPAGVIGLVASRLVSAYGRPTILFHITDQGIAKGSCRSVPAFNIFEALSSTQDLIDQFGGHAQAAGLSLPLERVALLKERLERRIADQLTSDDLQQRLFVDAHVRLEDLTKKFIQDIAQLEPFGNGNPQPLFCAENVLLVQEPQLLKDAHVKCAIFADGVIKQLIFFNRPDIYDILLKRLKEPFSVLAQVTENHWRGKISIELIGIDIAYVHEV